MPNVNERLTYAVSPLAVLVIVIGGATPVDAVIVGGDTVVIFYVLVSVRKFTARQVTVTTSRQIHCKMKITFTDE